MDTSETFSGGVLPWVSGLPPEIWTLVAEQIQGPNTFRALLRVCRAFRDIFTPFLYARHVLQLKKHPTSESHAKPLPTYLRHTEEFEVFVGEFPPSGISYEVGMNNEYALFIASMLRAMPNLRSFRWTDSSFEDGYGPSLMLRNKNFLNALKSCKKLQDLSIQFASQHLEDDTAACNCSMPLNGFRNLTSLELYQFYGDETQLINDIADVLSDCPRLKRLGLGMACDYDCDGAPEVLIMPGDCSFLERLCMRYEGQRKSPPLELETLRLGNGMFLHSPSSPDGSNFLLKLFKVDGLKSLHIFNGLVKGDLDDDEETMEIDWTFLSNCTSLRQLAVTRLQDDVRQWLNNGGKSVQELIVTEHYSMYDGDLDNLDALRLPHLSMLFIHERAVSKCDPEDEWSDVNSWELDSGSEDNDLPDLEHQFTPKLDRSVITVLDRLYDRGINLKRLGLCIDFETQWVEFSSHLPNLQNLSQLRLSSRSYRPGQYPTKASSLWPGVEKAIDIASHYATLIRSKCPSLQYIQIQHWAWQYMPKSGSTSTSGAGSDIYDQFELRRLEFDEVLSIELFAMASFVPQSGLPGPDEEISDEEISDEECERRDRIHQEVELEIREGRDPRSVVELFGDA